MLSHKTGERMLPQPMSVRWILVRQAHAAGGFRSQVHPDAQKVRGTGSFTPLATDTVFGARRGSDLTGFAAVPGNHLENVQGAGADALGATDAGIVDFD